MPQDLLGEHEVAVGVGRDEDLVAREAFAAVVAGQLHGKEVDLASQDVVLCLDVVEPAVVQVAHAVAPRRVQQKERQAGRSQQKAGRARRRQDVEGVRERRPRGEQLL